MKRVINGKRYDTETAVPICDISHPSTGRGDFRFEDTQLYRTAKGAWFIAGHGGALSRWAQSTDGQGGRCGGEGIHVIEPDDARTLLERFATAETVAAYFPVEDA